MAEKFTATVIVGCKIPSELLVSKKEVFVGCEHYLQGFIFNNKKINYCHDCGKKIYLDEFTLKQPDLLKGLVSYPNFLFLPGEIHTVKDYIIGVFLTSIAEPGAGLLVGCDIDSTYKFSKFRKYVETKLISFDLWFPDTFDVWAILD